MGELFKHFEGWDVQALRREISDAKEEAEKQKKEAEKQKEKSIQKLVKVIKELSGSPEKAQQKLMEEYNLSKESAVEKVALYW